MTKESNTAQEVKHSQSERAGKWGTYFRGIIQEKQNEAYAKLSATNTDSSPTLFDGVSEWIFLSKRFIARYIQSRVPDSRISDVSINLWFEGKAYPNKAGAGMIAQAFERNYMETMEAAGYFRISGAFPTLGWVLHSIRTDNTLLEEERENLLLNLEIAAKPDFHASHPDLSQLIYYIVEQDAAEITKARRIAALVSEETNIS